MASSVIGALRVNLGLDSAQFQSGAKKAEKTTDSLKGKFLSLVKPLAVAAAGFASVGGAIALAMKGAADIDKAAKSARRLGASIAGFRALEMAAGEAGVSLSTLTDAVQTMDREVARGGKNATDALAKLGLSAKDLAGLDADQKIALLGDRIKEMGLSTGQASALMQDLGIRSKDFLLAVTDGGDAIRAARGDIEDYGLAISQVDSDGIETANDAIGRLSLVGQYLAQQIALAVVPALGKMAKAMTDSLRQGGLLRGILDAIVLAVKGVVGAINLVIGAFSKLRTVIDLPERSIRWLLGLGPTALQAQRATDQLTLAIGDQARQLNTLVASMGPGVTMSKRMALAKLEEARAIYASMEAMRQQSLQMVQSTHEWAEAQATIDQAQRNMARVVSEQKQFTYDRGAIDDMRAQLQAAVDAQQKLLGIAAALSPEYIAAQENIERIEAAIAEATGETVTFHGELITAEDIARRLVETADDISFSSATSSAAELAKQLGVSVGLASKLLAMGYGAGNEVVLDPRDPRYNKTRATMAQLRAEAGTVSPFDPSRIPSVSSKGGGGGEKAEADSIGDVIKALKEEAAAIGLSEKARRIKTELQRAGVELYSKEGQEISDLIEQIDRLEGKERLIDRISTSIGDAIGKANSWGEAMRNLKQVFINAIQDMASKLISSGIRDLLTNALSGIGGGGGGGWVGKIIGALIGANANGTNNWRGGLTQVHERGGEIMNLPRGTQIIPHDISKRMADRAGAGVLNGGHISIGFDKSTGDLTATMTDIAGVVVQRARSGIVSDAVRSSVTLSQRTKAAFG